VANVGDNRVVLHFCHVLSHDDVFVSGSGNEERTPQSI
jgi:hypothetical protein